MMKWKLMPSNMPKYFVRDDNSISIAIDSRISVPYIAAANLIAGEEVVSEFLFSSDDNWQRVTARVRELWADGDERDRGERGNGSKEISTVQLSLAELR